MVNRKATAVLVSLAACVGLNAALTAQNAWPSIWVVPGARLSVELLVFLAVLGLYLEVRPRLDRLFAWCLAGALFFLIVGRYVAVTSHALFGRPINLYFDLPHLPDVIAMTAGVRSAAELAFFSVVGLALPVLMLALIRWGIGAVATSFRDMTTRRVFTGSAVVGIAIFAAASVSGPNRARDAFAHPVSPVYAHQVEFVLEALVGTKDAEVGAQPEIQPNIATLKGADVFILFLESYGEVAYRVPELSGEIRERAAQADRLLRAKGWHIATGLFKSPTFGGGSWLAHSSFLAGVAVSQNRDYQLLLSGERDTFVGSFRRAGYRTVALMPGLKLAWPEGDFYGFDKIYDASALDYAGPAYGWWTIPDQFSLGRLVERELQRPGRAPLFVVYPTIMSHLPFAPVPPVVTDWSRATDPAAYGKGAGAAGETLGNWKEARRSYRAAMVYNLAIVESFLAEMAPKDALVVAIGDHQPPGIVSGSKASWLVPVHIFSREERHIAGFLEAGFGDGLLPSGGSLGDFAALHRKFAAALK
jgi:hypothetical protein